MSFRLLAALPLVAAVIAFFAAAALGFDTAAPMLLGVVAAAKVAAVVGSLAAAFTFERGDYLRRAWLFAAVSHALLARELWLFPLGMDATIVGVSVETLNPIVVAVANVAGVIASWHMARAWNVAGLELSGSARTWVPHLFALAVALLITGAPLARDLSALAQGQPVPVIHLVSSLSDIASIVLIAPVLTTVVRMRGGLVAWPFGLYAASMSCWLAYDAADIFAHHLSAHGTGLHVAAEIARVLACGFLAVSGFAQRRAVLAVRAS